jgi:hypothetical protein
MGVPARHRERSGEAGGPPGNRRVLVSVPERYVAGTDTRGRREGRPYLWSQQVIHEISGLNKEHDTWKESRVAKTLPMILNWK